MHTLCFGFGRGMSCCVLSCCVFWDSKCSLVSMVWFLFLQISDLQYLSCVLRLLLYSFEELSAPMLFSVLCSSGCSFGLSSSSLSSFSVLDYSFQSSDPAVFCVFESLTDISFEPDSYYSSDNWKKLDLYTFLFLYTTNLIFPSTVPIYLTCSGKLGQ